MKKKKNTKNWVPKTPETNLENKGFSKKTASLNLEEKFLAGIDPVNGENHRVAVIKSRQLSNTDFQVEEIFRNASKSPRLAELIPSTIDEQQPWPEPLRVGEVIINSSTLDEQPSWPQPLREFWNPAYMENISFNGVEQTKEEIMKEMSEAGFLFVTEDQKDIRWAIDQLKKGEIVRNSAWPEENIGIIMKVKPNPSADVKLITEGDVSFQYKFTNEDVLFGTWEIVK